MMAEEKWRNFGDVSFVSEGGSMVSRTWDDETIKKYPALAHIYDVLMFARTPEDVIYAGIKQVDIEDYKYDLSTIESYFGEVPDDEMQLAAYCAEYDGLEPSVDRAYKQSGMYSQPKEFFLSKKEAADWCRELGVPEEYIR